MDLPQPHRFAYADELDRLGTALGELAAETRHMMANATAAITGSTGSRAESAAVHDAVRRVVERSREFDGDLVTFLAREAPVAGDLRLVLAWLRIAAAVERMAELADHVAATADLRAPAATVPAELRPTVTHLGWLCATLAGRLATALDSRDPAMAQHIEDADDPIDHIHRRLMAAVTQPDWPHGITAAVDLALLSRYYERFADQAVTAARRLARASSRPAAENITR